MQEGAHIGLGANENIVFLIAYTISFPKMYSFHTLQKIPTKLHSEPDYSIFTVIRFIYTGGMQIFISKAVKPKCIYNQ